MLYQPLNPQSRKMFHGKLFIFYFLRGRQAIASARNREFIRGLDMAVGSHPAGGSIPEGEYKAKWV